MEDREKKNQLQCIVDEGILVHRRDMVRILRDLGHVRYEDHVGESVRSQGEGYVVSVVSSDQASTIIVNKRLYLNVNTFDFVRLSTAEGGAAQIDLVTDQRVIRLLPLGDPLAERQVIVPADTLLPPPEALDKLFGDNFAEVYLEDDFDDDDD